jgi:hypothetical protein
MDISFNFLIQATRVLYSNKYDEDELIMIYDYLIGIDNDNLNDFRHQCTILTYSNDLELFMEILTSLIKIFEEKEEYEKCEILKNKLDECEIIFKNKEI